MKRKNNWKGKHGPLLIAEVGGNHEGDFNYAKNCFAENCYENGFSEILLITGQGHHSNLDKNVYVSKDHSTLKGTIPEFIKNTSSLYSKIINIRNASPHEGGKGALIIKLKKFKV